MRRCLAKDPERRIQSALDVRNELDELRREIDSGELASRARSSARPAPSTRATLGLGLVVGALTGGSAIWLSTPSPDPSPLVLRNTLQITSAAGVETQVAWSPDRGRIAYVSDQSGNRDIWITQAVGGAAVNLTHDYRGIDKDPAWSPDGTQIAFHSAREDDGIFLMPSIGGAALRIASRGSSEAIGSPAWSADGRQLAFLRREDARGVVEIVSLPSRESRRLVIPADAGNRFDLTWSPDGRFFAFVRAPGRNQGASTLWLLRASDGHAVAITDGTHDDWSPTWSTDPLTLFYVSNRSGSNDLWRQRLSADGTPDGEPVAMTAGVGMQQAAFSPDGSKLAFSKGRAVTNVWRVPLLDGRETTWRDAEQVTFDQALVSAFDVFPDGERLVISSDRGGNIDLWKVAIQGHQLTQLTSGPPPAWGPRVSPDGTRVAFYADRGRDRDIWVMPSDGGPAAPLTQDEAPDLQPFWSPDGSEVAFHSARSQATNVFVVAAASGSARQVTRSREAAYTPQWSPDGAWISFVSRFRLWQVPASGGTAHKLSDRSCDPLRYHWARKGVIYCVSAGDEAPHEVWQLDPVSRAERRVTLLDGGPGTSGSFGPGLATSATHLYFTWRADLGDIWVADVETAQRGR